MEVRLSFVQFTQPYQNELVHCGKIEVRSQIVL